MMIVLHSEWPKKRIFENMSTKHAKTTIVTIPTINIYMKSAALPRNRPSSSRRQYLDCVLNDQKIVVKSVVSYGSMNQRRTTKYK